MEAVFEQQFETDWQLEVDELGLVAITVEREAEEVDPAETF